MSELSSWCQMANGCHLVTRYALLSCYPITSFVFLQLTIHRSDLETSHSSDGEESC